VENVRGAQRWVGKARWNYGSFYLWGDVPALMPFSKGPKLAGYSMNQGDPKWSMHHKEAMAEVGVEVGTKVPGFRFDGSGKTFQTARVEGAKQGGDWWGPEDRKTSSAQYGSKSNARKAASAMIAKIPENLARHIARVYKPETA
jgi:hypothetical protein